MSKSKEIEIKSDGKKAASRRAFLKSGLALGGAAIAGKGRMDHIRAFFEDVGADDAAGVWEGDPNVRPDFRELNLKKIERQKKAEKAQGMI